MPAIGRPPAWRADSWRTLHCQPRKSSRNAAAACSVSTTLCGWVVDISDNLLPRRRESKQRALAAADRSRPGCVVETDDFALFFKRLRGCLPGKNLARQETGG